MKEIIGFLVFWILFNVMYFRVYKIAARNKDAEDALCQYNLSMLVINLGYFVWLLILLRSS